MSETNPSVSFRYGYTGRERDLESGLDYYRARYYDPANGVFISVDPMGFGAGDTNLYPYVGNSSTLATNPSGMASWLEDAWNTGVRNVQQAWNNAGRVVNNTVQSISQSAASIAQTVGDYAYGGLVTTDRVVAGLAGFATGGYTDRYREEQFGDKIAGQSDSFEYALGQSLGFGITTVLGVLTPQALLGKVGLGGRIAQGYTITQVGKGSYDTTTKIIDGKMDWSNPWSYVETVATFAPLLGPIARQLGKIRVVENAIAKATVVGENVWNSASQKASDSLRKWAIQQARDPKWSSEGGGIILGRIRQSDGSYIPNLLNKRPGTTGGPLIEITKNLERDKVLSHFPVENGFAKHHMIPIHVAQNFPVMRLAAKKLGYDINRGSNLIGLPTDRGVAATRNLLLHSGGHLPSYYKYVSKQINKLQNAFDKGAIKESDLLSSIEKIEDRIHYDISNKNVKL